MILIDDSSDGAVFTVRVEPQSKRPGIRGVHAGALRLGVAAAPERGQANRAVIAALADALCVAKSDLALRSGAANRTKRILAVGLDAAELKVRLEAALEAAGAPRDA